jgi:hypothetical protein
MALVAEKQSVCFGDNNSALLDIWSEAGIKIGPITPGKPVHQKRNQQDKDHTDDRTKSWGLSAQVKESLFV